MALAQTEAITRQSRNQVLGSLVMEMDGRALSEQKEAAQRGWQSDAIPVSASPEAAIRTSLEEWDQSCVVARGRLNVTASDHAEYWTEVSLDTPVLTAGIRGENIEALRDAAHYHLLLSSRSFTNKVRASGLSLFSGSFLLNCTTTRVRTLRRLHLTERSESLPFSSWAVVKMHFSLKPCVSRKTLCTQSIQE